MKFSIQGRCRDGKVKQLMAGTHTSQAVFFTALSHTSTGRWLSGAKLADFRTVQELLGHKEGARMYAPTTMVYTHMVYREPKTVHSPLDE